ncbi:MAG: ATP synthase subunit I [Pseudonocardiaceae bacterium]|nr:ATP synthase subunit I [Pseudonocardiaceae bacterium]
MSPSVQAAASLRRLALIAAGIGVVGAAVLAPLGYLALALYGWVGLALGLLNIALVHRSAARFATSEDSHKKRRSAGGVLGRLAAISLIAVAIAALVRPDGLGVLMGLVTFQFVMIITTLVPLVKELRRTGAQA